MRLFVLFSTIVLSFIEMREGVVAAKMEREWKYNARCYTIRKDINHSISAQLDFLVFLQSVLQCVAMYDTEFFVIPFACHLGFSMTRCQKKVQSLFLTRKQGRRRRSQTPSEWGIRFLILGRSAAYLAFIASSLTQEGLTRCWKITQKVSFYHMGSEAKWATFLYSWLLEAKINIRICPGVVLGHFRLVCQPLWPHLTASFCILRGQKNTRKKIRARGLYSSLLATSCTTALLPREFWNLYCEYEMVSKWWHSSSVSSLLLQLCHHHQCFFG